MNGELHNVPPIWTALFHWQSCLLYVNLLPRRWGRGRRAAIALAFLAAQLPYMCVIAPLDGLPFNLGMLGFAVLTLLPFALMCKGKLPGHLYYCARAFILGGFTVSLAWQLYSYYRPALACLRSFPAEAAFMLGVGAAVYFIMWLLERGRRRDMEELSIPLPTCVGAVAIAFVIYILSSLSYSTVQTPFAATAEADAFSLRTIAYLGGVAILYAYHLQLCQFSALREVNALQNVVDLQYANYQRSQESIDMVNRTYHDLKHQIAALRADLGAGQKLDCLDQIEQDIRAYESQNQTGNKVLDAILTAKASYCLDHGVTLTTLADGGALDFMGVVEVSALFGNALDNAIEGVSKLPDPEQRLIRLSVTQQRGFLCVKVENRCLDSLVVQGELPRTTKADKNLHGYGLKSIRATAERYGGSVTVQAEGGWFTLGVMIPIPKEKTGQDTE